MDLDNAFFKIIDDHIRMYENFLLPVVICDTGFTAHWFNKEIKSTYPDLIEERCILDSLAEFDLGKLVSQLRDGSFRIDGALGFSGIHMSLTPIFFEGDIAGVIVMLIAPQLKVSPQDVYFASQTPVAFEKTVRNNIEEIFRSMDIVSSKANMFESGWLRTNLHGIAQSSYHILRVAANISAYTSFQSRSPALVLQSADIFDILREAETTVVGLADSMGIPLSINLPEREGLAGLDIEKYQFAFLNVLHNSLYFTRPGNRIEITGSANDHHVEVAVRDCGMGIPGNIIENIFKPYFSRGHDGKPAGIGLGLTLAEKIMEAHGGDIRVESAPGKGTLVTLTVPRSLFSRRLSLRQGNRGYNTFDSFSYYYVGLSDAASSPYREDTLEN